MCVRKEMGFGFRSVFAMFGNNYYGVVEKKGAVIGKKKERK